MEEHNQRTVQTSIHRAICTVRGFKVMLDADLARLYGVEVRVLNAVGIRQGLTPQNPDAQAAGCA